MTRTSLTACALALFLQISAADSAVAQQSTWEPMNRGLLHLLVYTIEIDPVDSLVMYAGTDYGNLYKSTDGGFNWVLRRDGIPPDYNREYVSALFLDRGGRTELYCGFGGRQSTKNLFHSTDAGMTWEIINTPSSWSKGGILHIYRSYGLGSKLVCGLGWYTGIYLSGDAGSTWSQVLDQYGVQCVTGHPSDTAVLYAGTSSKGLLQRSVDGGRTWAQSAQGFLDPNNLTGVRAITVAPQDRNLVFTGVTGSGAGLYRSTDNGSLWTRMTSTKEISEIAVHPNNRNLIYYSAIGTGVWRTTDGGGTWAQLNDGMPTTDVMRVRVAPGYPVRVFAVTLKHGIYRLVDEELPEFMVR
jgi:photosystem II stability/assembly factor-like uncharacterized protein